MNEQHVPAKKSQMAGNLAGAGVIVGLIGLFLGWRASNLDTTSPLGTLLVVVAAVLLIAALVVYTLKHR